jgi:apolipoprotein N-acyltransferase
VERLADGQIPDCAARARSRYAAAMKPHVIAFFAGLASACGFEPFGLWPVTLACYALLLRQIEQAPRLRSALALGWWFGVGQFVLGLNWIATAFTYQAAMPAWLGWIAVVLLSLYLAVYPAAAAGLAWRHGRGDRLRLGLVFAAAWIVTEWLRATMFTGFAWNPLGVALLPTPVAHLATMVGTYGLSGVAALIAAVLFLLAGRRWRAGAAVAGTLTIAVGIAWALSAVPEGETRTKIVIVQPNIGQQEKWQSGFGARNFVRLAELSRAVEKGPRLLLWPEAAVTEPLQDGRRQDFLYQQAAEEIRRRTASVVGPDDLLLTGGITVQSLDGLEVSAATNSVFAMDAGGRVLARYDKAHLVPYGEYLPARPILSRIGLSRLAPGDTDFRPGPGPQTLELPVIGKAGFQLCYEIIFSGEVVDPANRPNFLFNPSNDAWFGAWGPPQHLAQARLRALEEGLPILRSTPTGISAVIDADGRLLHSLPWRTAGVIESGLPLPKPPTLFARLGNVLPLIFAGLLALLAIAVRRRTR